MENNLNLPYLTNYFSDDKNLANIVASQIVKNQNESFKKLVDSVFSFILNPNQEIRFFINSPRLEFAHAKAIQNLKDKNFLIFCGFKFDKESNFRVLPSEIINLIIILNPLLNFSSFKTVINEHYFNLNDEKIEVENEAAIGIASINEQEILIVLQKEDKDSTCCQIF